MTMNCEHHGALEQSVVDLREDVTEIKGDVKTLVAAHNQEKGFRLGAKGKSFLKFVGVGAGAASPFAALIWKFWCQVGEKKRREDSAKKAIRSIAVAKLTCKGALRSLTEPGMRVRLVAIDRALSDALTYMERM